MKLARFLPQLKIEYKPGLANVVVDALSRAPLKDTIQSTTGENWDPVYSKYKMKREAIMTFHN